MDVQRALEILDLPPGASPLEAKAAYRRALRESHPDRFAGDGEGRRAAEERTRLIIEAYRTLVRPAGAGVERFERSVWTQLNPFRRDAAPAGPYGYSAWERFGVWGSIAAMVVVTLLANIFFG